MYEVRKKVASPGSSAGARWLCLVILLVALGSSSACATTGQGQEEASADAPVQEVRPGAERWQEHALQLPANSPVVFSARSDRLLESLDRLRAWLLAEPAMFGPNGDQMVQAVEAEWAMMVGRLGMNPLEPTSWVELGVDPSREVYLGVYPADGGQGEAFVDRFEQAVRAQLEVGPDADLLAALDTMMLLAEGDLSAGVHAAAASAVRDIDPIEGFRAVVPVAERQPLLESIERLMRGAQYARAELEEDAFGSQYVARVYTDTSADWPGILVRVGEDVATIDIISRRSGPRYQAASNPEASKKANAALVERLRRGIDQVGFGRPAAPKAAAEPLMGVGADQEQTASYARLRGYLVALEQARLAGVQQRDAVFLQNIHDALLTAANWEVAAGKLTGVTYGLLAGEQTDGYVQLEISLVGPSGAEPLGVSQTDGGLAVSQRGLAASIDLLPIVSKSWQDWIGVTGPSDVIGNFRAADFDPALFLLAFPRSSALLFANLDKFIEDELPDEFSVLAERRELLRRIEIASAGINMRGLRVQPRAVAMLMLDPEATGEQRAQVVEAFETMIERGMAADRDEEAAAEEDNGEGVDIEVDKLISFDSDPEETPMHYYFNTKSTPSFLFFSYGLDREATRRELEAVQAAEQGPRRADDHTFYARAEPVTLFSLATTYDPTLFEPLDAGILAQRIGALVFSVEPEVVDGVQTIQFDFTLEKPPKLD